MIKEVSEIETQLVERGCLAGWYCPTLLLHVVGVLRKYHCCLLGEVVECLQLRCENVKPGNGQWRSHMRKKKGGFSVLFSSYSDYDT